MSSSWFNRSQSHLVSMKWAKYGVNVNDTSVGVLRNTRITTDVILESFPIFVKYFYLKKTSFGLLHNKRRHILIRKVKINEFSYCFFNYNSKANDNF